jgi:hypothetical protein
MLTAFWQSATTTYSRQNLSIINTDKTSAAEPYIIGPAVYQAVWDKLFRDNSTLPEDISMMKSVMYSLGWYLRLYEDDFSGDQQNPMFLLENFLTIPLLFSITAFQWANATCQGLEQQTFCDFIMPSNLITNASAASISYRFMGQPWTVYVFYAVGAVALLWPGCILGWIVLHKSMLKFKPSGFPPIDAALYSGSDADHLQGAQPFTQIVRGKLGSTTDICPVRKFIGNGQRVRVEKTVDDVVTLCVVDDIASLCVARQSASEDIPLVARDIGERDIGDIGG